MAYLAFGVFKKEVLKAVVKEFLVRGLDKTYAKEITEWKKHMDEKRFAVKLNKQMRDEIKRFQREIKSWTPKELEEIVWEGLDCLK